MRSLLALLLATAAVAADDPPFVAAARERQAKAKAFEVTLTVRKEWTGVTPVGSNEKKDFAGTGTAKLAVDGDRFWYEVDVPRLTGMGNALTRTHYELAFDGSQTYARMGSARANGPQDGQLEYGYSVMSPEGNWWDDGILHPLRWVFRWTEDQPPPSGDSRQMKWHESFRTTGREEVIDGTRCVEVERTRSNGMSKSVRPMWLDAMDYRPMRFEGTTIEYARHPTLGRVPSGWTIISPTAHSLLASRATVTVDSFELRDSIPNERFVIQFPIGSRVTRVSGNRNEGLIVAEDGSLVPVVKGPPPAPPVPELIAPSLQLSLWVVGGVVVVFVALVVLLKRLARNRTDDSPDSGSSPPLLS